MKRLARIFLGVFVTLTIGIALLAGGHETLLFFTQSEQFAKTAGLRNFRENARGAVSAQTLSVVHSELSHRRKHTGMFGQMLRELTK